MSAGANAMAAEAPRSPVTPFTMKINNYILYSGIGLGFFAIYLLSAVLYIIFVSLAWPFQYYYPNISTASPPPGNFVNQRYTWQWFLFMLPSLRFIVPVFGLYSMGYPAQIYRRFVYYFALFSLIFLDLGLGICNTVLFLPFCNQNSFQATGNICNDPRWCCVYYGSNPDFCPNTTGCPGVTDSADLVRFVPYLWYLGCFIAFGLFDIFSIAVLQVVGSAADKLPVPPL